MGVPKIEKLVESCEGCPRKMYESGGRYLCQTTGQIIRDVNLVAPFCPLPDYPAKVIASMEATIEALRDPNKYAFPYMLMAFLAAKLGLTIDSRYLTIEIPLANGKSVLLQWDHVTGIDLQGYILFFSHKDRKFKIELSANAPKLYESVSVSGVPDPLWTQLN